MVLLPPCEMWTKFLPVSLFYGQLIFENKHPLFLGLNGLIYREVPLQTMKMRHL